MLDAEALRDLPDELKARLVEFEKTFGTLGWSFVVEWARKSADEMRDRMLFCTSWEQYIALQSRWTIFTELSMLEEETYKEFERLAYEAREEAALAVLGESVDIE